jgi:hypothetical protein
MSHKSQSWQHSERRNKVSSYKIMEEDTQYTGLIYDLEIQYEVFLKWCILNENGPDSSWQCTKIPAVWLKEDHVCNKWEGKQNSEEHTWTINTLYHSIPIKYCFHLCRTIMTLKYRKYDATRTYMTENDLCEENMLLGLTWYVEHQYFQFSLEFFRTPPHQQYFCYFICL